MLLVFPLLAWNCRRHSRSHQAKKQNNDTFSCMNWSFLKASHVQMSYLKRLEESIAKWTGIRRVCEMIHRKTHIKEAGAVLDHSNLGGGGRQGPLPPNLPPKSPNPPPSTLPPIHKCLNELLNELKYTMQYKTVSPTAVFTTAQHPCQGLYYLMEGWHFINLVKVLEKQSH